MYAQIFLLLHINQFNRKEQEYMTNTEIKDMVMNEEKYSFLKKNPYLGNNIILLCIGGSHAYGTNNEHSDVDIRGIALNSKEDLLLWHDFEQVIDTDTDTTVYSLLKIMNLFINCNPNTIEMLGCRKNDYIMLSETGKEILKNKNLFLSKKAFYTFGGYANQQLYRLAQKAKNAFNKKELEEHILRTLNSMKNEFNKKYTPMPDDGLLMYIDKSNRQEYETEIFMDIRLTHYPVRDYASLWSELQNTVKAYGKLGKRNKQALEHDKISKHMMHLVRLYYMCFDILEKKQITTYREEEHDFLMEIRNGRFISNNNSVMPEFFDIVHDFEKRMQYAMENTDLPDFPDMEKINELKACINEKVIYGNI